MTTKNDDEADTSTTAISSDQYQVNPGTPARRLLSSTVTRSATVAPVPAARTASGGVLAARVTKRSQVCATRLASAPPAR
ncbi:MAG: hypothetical protein P8Y02_08035 [Deinococcales bacterium]